jgi:hypothetical protein
MEKKIKKGDKIRSCGFKFCKPMLRRIRGGT